MGFKEGWQTCDRKDLNQYFNVMHKVSQPMDVLCTIGFTISKTIFLHTVFLTFFCILLAQALDMYMSVAILRVPNGLDCSQILGDESSAQRNILDVPRTLQTNESSADLNAVERNAQNGLSGSMDSLSRNVSQGRQ